MSWNFSPRILIQGIHEISAQQYLQCEANIHGVVAGIGEADTITINHQIPQYHLVSEAITHEGEIFTSLIFSHPYNVLDSGLEAIKAGIKQLVINTEKIPPLDLLKLYRKANQENVKILGVGEGGILIPHHFYCGIYHPEIFTAGNVAIINYSDQAIAVDMMCLWQKDNLGVSMVINVGNTPLTEVDWDLWLDVCRKDENTEAIIIYLGIVNMKLVEKLGEAINKDKNKKVIICFLDSDNIKSKIDFSKGKVISDQIYSHLYPLPSWELVKQHLENTHALISDQYQLIPSLI